MAEQAMEDPSLGVTDSYASVGEAAAIGVDRTACARAHGAVVAAHTSGRPRVIQTTCERDYMTAEVELMMAMEEYKRRSGRMFPTWSEVLEVLMGLGYQKANGAVAVPEWT